MQFSRQRHRPNEDDRILPLTNVVFLLLIFFMLAGQLSSPNALSIQPPHSISKTPAGSVGLLIKINTDGAIMLDGRPVAADRLESTVAHYLTKHPQAPIRLKADGLTDASRVVAIMTLLREAGVKQLRLLTAEVKH